MDKWKTVINQLDRLLKQVAALESVLEGTPLRPLPSPPPPPPLFLLLGSPSSWVPLAALAAEPPKQSHPRGILFDLSVRQEFQTGKLCLGLHITRII